MGLGLGGGAALLLVLSRTATPPAPEGFGVAEWPEVWRTANTSRRDAAWFMLTSGLSRWNWPSVRSGVELWAATGRSADITREDYGHWAVTFRTRHSVIRLRILSSLSVAVDTLSVAGAAPGFPILPGRAGPELPPKPAL